MLITMDMEFTALDNPTSDFISSVNAGAADAIGANTKIINTWRISNENGKHK